MTPLEQDYLSFRLPPFARSAWVSDSAQKLWLGRFHEVRKAWSVLERRSVERGLRPCCAVIVKSRDLPPIMRQSAAVGLSSLPVRPIPADDAQMAQAFQVVSGSLDDCRAFVEASLSGDHVAMGRLLGYPDCCTDFYARFTAHSPGRDPVWAVAGNTVASRSTESCREIEPVGTLDILCRSLSLAATPHLPCRFDCKASLGLARAWRVLGRELGYIQEMKWLEEILAWPVEWSTLHGIAEVKTPVVKLITRMDATAHKYTIRYLGPTPPGEGAQGLSFPYRRPPSLAVADSPGFARGLKNPV